MATQAEVDQVIQALVDHVGGVADDTRRWSQQDSVDIYEGVAASCVEFANVIRSEMTDGE